MNTFGISCNKTILISAPPDCEAGKFSCGDYKFNATYCIQPHFRCDKTYDCHDKSDESNCNYRQQHDGDHECKPVPGEESAGSLWIPKENVCNGYFDCRDHSDEADCDKSKVSCEVRLKKIRRDILLENKCNLNFLFCTSFIFKFIFQCS